MDAAEKYKISTDQQPQISLHVVIIQGTLKTYKLLGTMLGNIDVIALGLRRT